MAFTFALLVPPAHILAPMAHTMRTGAEHYVYRYNVLCVPVAAVLTLQLSVGVGLLSDVPLNALSASHLRRAGRVGDPLGSPASRASAIVVEQTCTGTGIGRSYWYRDDETRTSKRVPVMSTMSTVGNIMMDILIFRLRASCV